MRGVLALAAATSLALAGCGQDPAAVEQDSGDEALPDPGGTEQLTAPEPSGDQRSHQAMREALRSVYDAATLTDTNDVLPGARDLETELQRLAVDPQECKQHVVTSAMPVPDDALIAAAQVSAGESGSDEDDSESSGGSEDAGGSGDSAGSSSGPLTAGREATVMSFLDVEAAAARIDGEQEGVENCPSYTTGRSSGSDGEEGDGVSTETTMQEEPVRTAAEQGFAVIREVSGGGSTSRSVNVVLREGAQLVTVSASVDGELSSDATEDAVEAVQEEAARVLGEVSDEDLSLEEEPEDDSGDDGSEGAGDSGDGSSGEEDSSDGSDGSDGDGVSGGSDDGDDSDGDQG
ncbi:hypothetical protein [Nesterenkonia sp. F]|uniref:hypothetical protein n=1 Tax=Nesterenkonia sp. F TaxID=795955 RepID=UPI000255D32D|nr:hypothetical protein [Nesterenkonia sp. F]